MNKNILYIILINLMLVITSCQNEPITNNITEPFETTKANFVQQETAKYEEAIGGYDGEYCNHTVVSYHVPGGYVYDDSYHSIPGELLKYINNPDRINKWVEEISIDSNENINIVNFVNDFNIPREVFQTILDNSNVYYLYDYNLEIIYSNDEKIIEEYYTTGMNRIDKLLQNKYVGYIKGQLELYINETQAETYHEWISNKNKDDSWKYSKSSYDEILIYSVTAIDGTVLELYSNEFNGDVRQWSIAEFVNYFNIPKDVIENIMISIQESMPSCNLDIEKLYNTDIYRKISDEHSDSKIYANIDPVLIDNSYISIDMAIQQKLWDDMKSLEFYG